MLKTDVTAFATRTAELIAANAIHAICLILAFVPVPFILYYITELHLWGTDLQFIFQTIAFTAGICILIYAGLRTVIWLLYAIVPVIVWLLYIAVHGLAWLLRTVIVPGTLWLLSIGLPAMISLLYAAACSLAQWWRNRDRPLNTRWPDLQKIARPQILLLVWGNGKHAVITAGGLLRRRDQAAWLRAAEFGRQFHVWTLPGLQGRIGFAAIWLGAVMYSAFGAVER